jgi:uncharacterized repeat protein (TIGR03806 family)
MSRFIFLLLVVVACSGPKKEPQVVEVVRLGVIQNEEYPKNLSEWNFYSGEMKSLEPVQGILPYDLNTPLFSDYAYKARFIRLPEGQSITYHSSESLNFPKGTVLIKNFYYPDDFRNEIGSRRILETRLLVHEENGWFPMVYVWNEQQTEAERVVTGKEIPVEWKDINGKLQRINYSVPSQPQCRSCHELSAGTTPIGTTTRQLNKGNQLSGWIRTGLVKEVPTQDELPQLPIWDDPSTGTLESRARAWLEINCAHCHRREGPAKNSGLYLLTSETDRYRLGVNKPPIAAGKASAGLKYSIVPGQPDKSIMLHRIQSLEPGEMMPELGRKLPHEEGISLVREWIASMKSSM